MMESRDNETTMRKGFSLLWIIWIVVVILVAVAIFLYFSRIRQAAVPPPPPSPIETPSPTQTPVTLSDDRFYAIGALAKDKPGMKAGVWYLVYDAADGSSQDIELVFTAESQCTIGSRTEACALQSLVRGARVEVVGNRTDSQVRVRTLVQLDLDEKG